MHTIKLIEGYNSLSATKSFEDDDLEISKGACSSGFKQEKIIIIKFKKLNLEVIAGARIRQGIEEDIEENATIADMLSLILINTPMKTVGEHVSALCVGNYERGVKEGERNIRKKLRDLTCL